MNLRRAMLATALLAMAAGPLQAQDYWGRGGVEIAPYYGVLSGIGNSEFEEDPVPFNLDNNHLFGARLGYVFRNGVGIEGYFGYLDSKVEGSALNGEKATGMNYGGDLAYNISLEKNLILFLAAGAGVQSWDVDVTGFERESAFAFNYGAGIKMYPARWLGLRLDWRNYHSQDGLKDLRAALNPTDAVLEDKTLASTEWSIGASIFLGGPKDSDGDGVPDSRDACPDTPKGVAVDASGCPFDTDGDGVADYLDQCPDTPAGALVDANGCPMDSDGDGVFDGIDQCPNTPAGAEVNENGCPSDQDGDGVFNGIDLCPNTPRGVVVDATGCPIDSDGDGVFDGPDQCPNTPEGARVDARGCLVQLELRNIEFEFNSFELTAGAREYLRGLAGQIVQQADPQGTARLELRGYTDSVGADAYNQRLSKQRADAVMQFLVGADPGMRQLEARISSVGYGKADPVASNDTEEGRARNRRVELHIITP